MNYYKRLVVLRWLVKFKYMGLTCVDKYKSFYISQSLDLQVYYRGSVVCKFDFDLEAGKLKLKHMIKGDWINILYDYSRNKQAESSSC